MMKRNTLCRIFAASAFAAAIVMPGYAQERDTLTLFNDVTFYDGYQMKNNPDSALQDGILRHLTSLYAVKLTESQLDQIGDSLEMHVSVRACCDDYDRIGNLNLAFVPKGQEKYVPEEVDRIEIGRFITPFMNMNKKPDVVPYEYKVPYLSYIFQDAELRAKYDFWVEYQLFGVPYAANQEVKNCAGRSDVFKGTLKFSSLKSNQGVKTDKDVLVPVVIKKEEYLAVKNLNNYSESATDTLGKTTKTYWFDVPKDVETGMLVIVTSNHGANENGEEYNRRWHYVYVDDELMMGYKPGRTSCEPFRKYNTMSNGIYGLFKRSDATWQSFSNWCPGDVIDNRILALGAVKAGRHSVRISVPEAVFADSQGDIPVSIFFQGLTQGTVTGVDEVQAETKPLVELRIGSGNLTAISQEGVAGIELRDLQGKLVRQVDCEKTISISGCVPGVYIVSVELTNGIVESHKLKI